MTENIFKRKIKIGNLTFNPIHLVGAMFVFIIILTVVIKIRTYTQLSLNEKLCIRNVRKINAKVMKWYLKKGNWPSPYLDDIGSDKKYFRNEVPICPISKKAYFLGENHRVSGHLDGDHYTIPLSARPTRTTWVSKKIPEGVAILGYSSGVANYEYYENDITKKIHVTDLSDETTAKDISSSIKVKSFYPEKFPELSKDIVFNIEEGTFEGSIGDYFYTAKKTEDGGYIIGGLAQKASGNIDFYLIRIGQDKKALWSKSYGTNDHDFAQYIEETKDSGYIIAGYGSCGKNRNDIWLVKLDKNGNLEWSRAYGGSGEDRTNFVLATSGGGYIVIGRGQTAEKGGKNASVFKVDQYGKVQWSNIYGGENWDYCSYATETQDDGYLVVGDSRSFGTGSFDVFAMKLKKDGQISWAKIYGGSEGDFSYSVAENPDGTFIIVGYTRSFGTKKTNTYLIKADSAGDAEWALCFGGKKTDYARSVLSTGEEYIVAGDTTSFGAGQTDVYVARINSKGKMNWIKTYGGIEDDYISSIQRTSNGGYIITGNTYFMSRGTRNFFVLELDKEGNVEK